MSSKSSAMKASAMRVSNGGKGKGEGELCGGEARGSAGGFQ